jgi:hypothetical protein
VGGTGEWSDETLAFIYLANLRDDLFLYILFFLKELNSLNPKTQIPNKSQITMIQFPNVAFLCKVKNNGGGRFCHLNLEIICYL